MNIEERLADQAYQRAAEYELDYGCCPQCVLAAVQETVGIVDDATIKASHGLSGGGGLTGKGICGALAGGLIGLGARFGRDRSKFEKGRFINNFRKNRELIERFRAEFGGITCEELQKAFTGRTYDMWNAGEYKAFDDARGRKCAHAAGTVARWTVGMMTEVMPVLSGKPRFPL
ncbi:MAG TPA: C-GCAxxG-C-C family protein [Burkholderiales bacterium]|nr:C-GCAxxG-C-C family protein [Burkholderiales bacterium]